MRRLPLKIVKQPWIDASVEIRFKPIVDRGAVFGLVYYPLKDTYTKVDYLSTRSEAVDAFEYRIQSEKFSIQIGADSISVHCNDPYPGWNTYLSEILKVLEIVRNQNLCSDVTRVSVRYINFFPYATNIFRHLRLRITYPERSISDVPTIIKLTFQDDESFITTLQVANTIEASKASETVLGSIIEIDTYRETGLNGFLNNAKNVIDKAHEIEKRNFFDLFTDEYLDFLNPRYDEDESNKL